MGPIRLTDAQLTAVFEAARPLAVASRDAFLLDLAAALQGIVDRSAPCNARLRSAAAHRRAHTAAFSGVGKGGAIEGSSAPGARPPMRYFGGALAAAKIATGRAV
jgi:hypothetical protein